MVGAGLAPALRTVSDDLQGDRKGRPYSVGRRLRTE